MKWQVGASLGALAVMVAVPAQAADKRDFELCDGMIHPARAADGMRREADSSSYSFLRAQPGGNVEACNRALASPRLLPTQTVRRAHLLRARAAAYLQKGDTAKALTDLDQAAATASAAGQERFYARSMGVSLDLLRALAHAQAGDSARAVSLAQSAMQARPYALQVQRVGAEILQLARSNETGGASPWLGTLRLEPDAVHSALIGEAERGNFAGVLALRSGVELKWPKGPLQPLMLLAQSGDGEQLLSSLIISYHTAYALAASGDVDGARKELTEIRAHLAATRPANAGAAPNELEQLLDNYATTRSKQVEARIAVAEGRPSEAIAALVATPMPKDAATVDLIQALKAKAPAKDAALVPDPATFMSDAAEQRRKRLPRLAQAALIPPETPRAVINYDKSRPNVLGMLLLGGVTRTDGFRSTANPDGTIKVEFMGNTTSAPVVQEMTLLRAAELAREANKPAFVIVDRKDFTRTLNTTQYGHTISSTPMGFKTELTIRFVDAGSQSDRALDALSIIDALGPLYYEEKPSKA